MTVFQKTYIKYNSIIQVISKGLMFFSLVFFFFFLIRIYTISYFAGIIAFIILVFYVKGNGKVTISKKGQDLFIELIGKDNFNQKIEHIDFGWSYQFSTTPMVEPYPLFGWYWNKSKSGADNRRRANTLVLNALIHLENGEFIIVNQKLPPWGDIPKGWKYVGNDIHDVQNVYSVKSRIEQLAEIYG